MTALTLPQVNALAAAHRLKGLVPQGLNRARRAHERSWSAGAVSYSGRTIGSLVEKGLMSIEHDDAIAVVTDAGVMELGLRGRLP